MAAAAVPEGLTAIALDLTAGSVGGMVGVVVGHPLDVVKTRMQAVTCDLRGLSARECLAHTWRTEGVVGMWRGVAPPIVAGGLWKATVFASFGWSYKECKACGMDEESARLSAGFFSGFCSTFITMPTDAVKIQLQLEKGASDGALSDMVRCGRRMVAEHGVSSLLRGFSSCILRDIPNVSFYLYAYNKVKRLCFRFVPEDGRKWQRMGVEAVAGGAAGSASWATSMPMDVVKTVRQEAAAQGRSIGLAAACRDVLRRDGLRGFTRGMGPMVVRAFPVHGLTFCVYEDLKRLMGVPSNL